MSDRKVTIIGCRTVYDNRKLTKKCISPDFLIEIEYKVGDKFTTQNYLSYADLAIVIPVRNNSETGEKEFGLVEQEAPALIHKEGNSKTPEGYKGIMLEGMSVAIPKENIETKKIAEYIKDAYHIDTKGIVDLDTTRTSVLESFSNQCANFYTAGVIGEDENNQVHWFPISSLRDFLEMQRMANNKDVHTSISTLYALELLYDKYSKEIKNQTEFKLEKKLPELMVLKTMDKKKGYRFSIKECYYINTNDYTPEELTNIAFALNNIQEEEIDLHEDDNTDSLYVLLPRENEEPLRVNVKVGSYAQSNMKSQQSNAGNTMLVTENGERILSPQIRSPFLQDGIENGNYIRWGGSGGMLEPGEEDLKKRALKELLEEQGFKDDDKVEILTGVLAASPNCTEMSQCFVAYYEKAKDVGELDLDEAGEFIGEKIPFSHDKIKGQPRIALTTKYYDLVMNRLEQERESDKIQHRIELEERE